MPSRKVTTGVEIGAQVWYAPIVRTLRESETIHAAAPANLNTYNPHIIRHKRCPLFDALWDTHPQSDCFRPSASLSHVLSVRPSPEYDNMDLEMLQEVVPMLKQQLEKSMLDRNYVQLERVSGRPTGRLTNSGNFLLDFFSYS